jgi:hypothetical protein
MPHKRSMRLRHLPAEAASSQGTRVKSAPVLSPAVSTRAATRPAETRFVLGIERKHGPRLGAGVHHLVVLGKILGHEWVIPEPVDLLTRQQQVRTPAVIAASTIVVTPDKCAGAA